jgi:hypothetical protein
MRWRLLRPGDVALAGGVGTAELCGGLDTGPVAWTWMRGDRANGPQARRAQTRSNSRLSSGQIPLTLSDMRRKCALVVGCLIAPPPPPPGRPPLHRLDRERRIRSSYSPCTQVPAEIVDLRPSSSAIRSRSVGGGRRADGHDRGVRRVQRYGDLVTVDGLSFTMDRGEVLALLGPNGAGKTLPSRFGRAPAAKLRRH